MLWPRMTTRQLMIAAAVVASACAAVSGLTRRAPFAWSLVSLLVVMWGFYLAAAFCFGIVLDWVDALGPRSNRPREDPPASPSSEKKGGRTDDWNWYAEP